MLKSIATAHSECKTKHENKASYNTNFIGPDLIDFLGDNLKNKYLFSSKILWIDLL